MSHFILISLGVSTVKTNRDGDRNFSICRDQLLKTVENVHHWPWLCEIFVETVEINRDCQDLQVLSRLFEIYRDILTLSRLFEVLQDKKSRQIEKSRSRNVIKLTNSRSRLRQIV